MKNIFKYSLILLLAAGCTGRFEEYNTDRFGASNEELQRDGYSTRSSLVGLADGIIALDVNTTQFTECLLGGPMAGYMADADANAGFNYTIGNFNAQNNWTKVLMEDFPKRIYPNLRQLKQVTSDETILAVGNVIKVAGMHRIADTYGPMPYSQIGEDGALQVPFDSQEKAYKTMMEELDAAIDILTANRTNNFNASSDVIFGGNVEKWCRYANSLKLRLAMRMSYADPAYAQQKAEEAAAHPIGTMASAGDIAQLTNFGNDGNPLYVAVNYNRVSTHADGTACITTGDSHAAADIVLYMNGYKDPRRDAYFTRCEFDGVDFVGLRHGTFGVFANVFVYVYFHVFSSLQTHHVVDYPVRSLYKAKQNEHVKTDFTHIAPNHRDRSSICIYLRHRGCISCEDDAGKDDNDALHTNTGIALKKAFSDVFGRLACQSG